MKIVNEKTLENNSFAGLPAGALFRINFNRAKPPPHVKGCKPDTLYLKLEHKTYLDSEDDESHVNAVTEGGRLVLVPDEAQVDEYAVSVMPRDNMK